MHLGTNEPFCTLTDQVQSSSGMPPGGQVGLGVRVTCVHRYTPQLPEWGFRIHMSLLRWPPLLATARGHPSCKQRSLHREWQGLNVRPHNFLQNLIFFPNGSFPREPAEGNSPTDNTPGTRIRPNYLKAGGQEASLLAGCPSVTDPSTARALPLRLGELGFQHLIICFPGLAL